MITDAGARALYQTAHPEAVEECDWESAQLFPSAMVRVLLDGHANRRLHGANAGDRKPYSARRVRLAACAVARLALAGGVPRRTACTGDCAVCVPTVGRVERAADGRTSSRHLRSLVGMAGASPTRHPDAYHLCAPAPEVALCGVVGYAPRAAGQTGLRCAFGNPFHKNWLCGGLHYLESEAPLDHPCCAALLTPAVTAIAVAAYRGRDWDALPILADALEDAGSPSRVTCTHCGGLDWDTRHYVPSRPKRVDGPFGCAVCAGRGTVVNRVLAHLRGGGPHARGCWALELALARWPERERRKRHPNYL